MKRELLLAAAAVVVTTAIATSCSDGDKSLQTTTYSDGLKFCEGSAPYGSTLLVSNFGTAELNPLNSEGKGYIMQFDGEVISPFITADGTLSAPKGMAIGGDYLYVADVAKVVIYNLKNREAAPVVLDMPEGELFVNDIVISGESAYISVTNSGMIFKLDISSPSTTSVEDLTPYAEVVGANGLVIDGNTMYIASYPADGNTTEENVIYKIESINTPVVTKLIERKGQYDGLAKSGNRLYFTNWIDGEFGYVDIKSGEVTIEDLADGMTFAGPADISLFGGNIYLPDLPNSTIVKINLKK